MMPPTRDDLLARLSKIESDPRIRDYPPADTFSNAVLALVQVALPVNPPTARNKRAESKP